MRQHVLSSPRRLRRRVGSATLIGALSVAALTGCASGELRGNASTGWLPPAVTEGGEVVTNLWIGTWIAGLAVGVLVWGLIAWCVVAYRRHKDDNELPVQLRYNIPIEILYTVVPIFMVVVLFYYTARDEATGDLAAQKILGATSSKIARFENLPLVIKEIESGGVQAMVSDSAVVGHYIKNNGDKGFSMVEVPDFDVEQYGIAVRPEDSALLQTLNQSLQKVRDSGEYEQIYSKYFAK